jgi:hypothetical protein
MRPAPRIVARLAGLAALVAGAALAQPEDVGPGVPMIARGAPISQQDASTTTGRPVLLFHYVHIDAHCGPDAIAILVTAPPAHGSLTFENGEERPWSGGRPMFGPDDARARCGNRLAATKDGVYTPAPGFTGHDSMVVEFTEAGVTLADEIDVSVR